MQIQPESLKMLLDPRQQAIQVEIRDKRHAYTANISPFSTSFVYNCSEHVDAWWFGVCKDWWIYVKFSCFFGKWWWGIMSWHYVWQPHCLKRKVKQQAGREREFCLEKIFCFEKSVRKKDEQFKLLRPMHSTLTIKLSLTKIRYLSKESDLNELFLCMISLTWT